jgi:hypothetical protein
VRVHLQNQSANRAVTGLFRQTSGRHDVENRLRQPGKVIPNAPAEMAVQLSGYQVFESCGFVLPQSATPVVERQINRPGPRIRWCF